MVTITPTEGNSKELEAGTFPARLVSIVHQGTSIGRFGPQTQAVFKFILPTEKQDGDKYAPFVNVFINVSYGKNAQFLTVLSKLGIDPTKPFELEKAIGKECQITVGVKDGYYTAKHKDIAPLVKGLTVPKLDYKTQFFWFDADYEWEVVKDDKGEPVLDEEGREQNKKVNCRNVVMTGFDCLTEKQIDKVVQSWEYNWLQKNGVNKQTETEADSSNLPF